MFIRYLYCSRREGFQCRGRLIAYANGFMRESQQHNHLAQPEDELIYRFKVALFDRVTTVFGPPARLYEEVQRE